jgi:hypothetical protein
MQEVQIKFFDNIVTPWRKLNSMLSEHPLAVNPDSNVLVANAQSLAITLNHFREKNPETGGDSFLISNDLRNFANSSKHKKGSETSVCWWISPTYECADGKFRFMENRITCRYSSALNANKDREFSASTEIWEALKKYAQVLSIDVSPFAPNESSYGFLPVAVAFSRPEYSALTKSSRITLLKKNTIGYELFNPSTVSFVVLGEEALGSNLAEMDWSFSNT